MSDIDIAGDEPLLALLLAAEPDDVCLLVDYLTDAGKGRVSLASTVKDFLHEARKEKVFDEELLKLLIHELRMFGGNSVANLFRRGGVTYKEIVSDVLSHVGGKATDTDDLAARELDVLRRLLGKAWDKMSEEERAQFADKFGESDAASPFSFAHFLNRLGFGEAATLSVTSFISASLGANLLGAGAVLGAEMIMGRMAGAVFGPIGIAVGAALAGYSLASPAYRITLPCVVQIAYIRQKGMLPRLPGAKP
ncbi:hypothetical protein [Pseudomonas sp. NA-150]|uniref:hypothetical protein n=1 Tax=Pseudomonas sp. NA-150 TaxID=3367525 RepID=UPI0037C76E64